MEIGNQVGLGTLLLDVLGIAPSTNQDLYSLFTKLKLKPFRRFCCLSNWTSHCTTLQMFAGIYRDFPGKSECGGLHVYPQSL